ncbi:S-adenosylmethionine decarboxylase [Prolixibacteraceae bacterium]|nr:S-adenosylmethionine decarboxylase [Prolixibacteraceae bacterium]
MTKVAHKTVDAKIFKYSGWIEDISPSNLKKDFHEILVQSHFMILSFSEHFFEKEGYSCVWLLAESHLALHTFPNKNKCYMELSSCNNEKMKEFRKLLLIHNEIKLVQEEESASFI